MPYYGDGSPYYLGTSPYANHSSLLTGVNRYFNPIAARYSPHLSTISETPLIARRRHVPSSVTTSTTSFPRPRRIIDTADIDVSKPPRGLAQDSRPHRLRRDRPTIKIRSQALKDNPALREYNEKHEKTVGELLVEKFLIKDKQNDDIEGKMRLYHQASLASSSGAPYANQSSSSSLSKEREDEILASIRHRITRRMTRRRSSADVIPLDPEQIKREAALQAAQAEALDSLVAQEQAEIEVEVKKGTFAKKLTMTLPTDLSEASGTEGEDDDLGEDLRRDRIHKRHTAKKKKRKKIDVPALAKYDVENDFDDEEDDDEDTLEIPESVIEEEEEEDGEQDFQWDDREKCDNIEQFLVFPSEILENGDVGRKSESQPTAENLNGRIPERISQGLDKTRKNEEVGNSKVPKNEKILDSISTVEKMHKLKTDKLVEVSEKPFSNVQENVKNSLDSKNCRTSAMRLVQMKTPNQNEREPKKLKKDGDEEKNQRQAVADRKKKNKINEDRGKMLVQETTESLDSEKHDMSQKTAKKTTKSEEKYDDLKKGTRSNLSKTGANEEQINLKDIPTPKEKLIHLNKSTSNGTSPNFKIEACNSVGDFSTLYVKSANGSAETSIRSIEQFRESIRLPAPRREAPSSIETEVVLPVRKPYVRDISRNSVYLALKPSQIGSDNNKSNDEESANDKLSIITDDMRKESESITEAIAPMLAKNADTAGNRSIIERDSPAAECGHVSLANDHDVAAHLTAEELTCSVDPELTNQKVKKDTSGALDQVVESVIVDQKENAEDWWGENADASAVKSKSKSVESGVPVELEAVVASVENNVKFLKKADDEKQKAQRYRSQLSEKSLQSEKTLEKVKVSLPSTTSETKERISSPGREKGAASNRSENQSRKCLNKTELSETNIPDRVPLVLSPAGVENVSIDVGEKVSGGTVLTESPKTEVKETLGVTEAKSGECSLLGKSLQSFGEEEKTSSPSKVSNGSEKRLIPSPTKELASQQTSLSKDEKLAKQSKVTNHSNTDKKKPNNDSTKIRHELLRIDHRHLPKIPEEPKTASPLEKKNFELPIESKKPPEQVDKSSIFKTGDDVNAQAKLSTEALSIKSVSSGQITKAAVKKDRGEVKKKRVDAEAVMKIEKKILEDAESPCKIVSSAMPAEPLAVEASVKKDEQERLAPTGQQKVGLQPSEADTKKKSAEQIAAAAAAGHRVASEIDFWSEIKATDAGQEIEKVSGTPEKAQSASDSGTEERPLEVAQAPESLRLKPDLPKASLEDQDEAKTPLVPGDPEDQTTPLVEDPHPVVPKKLRESSLLSCHSLDDDFERSATVKKISKWSNLDNLSTLNEAEQEATTPLASNEPSPVVSAASSTVTKKKVVKRKKSTSTTTKKKASEKGENSTKKKTQTSKKSAASPQTSTVQRGPTSASGRNSPAQRPADLTKMFYTTPAILLTATPRDLRKVRRAKVKRKKPPTRTPSLSSDSTGSTRSTATNSNSDASNAEEDLEHKRLASTRSNDSGFDGSPRLSNCDMVCHKKCEKLTGNLCGLNQKLVAEALQALKKAPSQACDNQRTAEGEHCHHSGRITPPATNLPRFKKYEVVDFNFLKVLGKGSFGKVLLAELRGTECVYAVKCLKKDVVLEDDDVECTLIERKVLTLATRHPYLCHLFCTFQTESHLFFVMEYLNGGDLMFHIQTSGRFSETRAKFYAAEIWSGLIFLHKKGIVYRDLKLDNVLLDFEGHIRIADFGMCKLQIFLDRTADTFCGTPDYMAPEIIKGLKYNQAVDWWSFGVLLYEMLTGQSPFSGCDEDELFWSICNERPFIPRYLGQSATELLVALLEKDSGKRIPGHEIACHAFFCNIAWDKLERRQLEAPFKPAVEHTLDTRYFDTAFTTERPRLTLVPEHILSSMDQAVFRGFSYTNPNATD